MDYLQYQKVLKNEEVKSLISFKPYYKWITFNTYIRNEFRDLCRKERF